MTKSIWIPESLYKKWPWMTLFMSLGYFLLGYRTMALILLLYTGWICLNRMSYLIDE